MELQTLKVSTRDGLGKEAAKKVRQMGRVPGVVYGGEGEPVSLTMDLREFSRLIHGRGGEHAIVQLDVENDPPKSGPAMLKAVQHHPVKGEAIHADFMRISLEERITTVVNVVLTGRAPGVVEGGVLDQLMREIEVECRALEVPESISVDISGLAIGDSIHVAALVVAGNVTIVSDPERMVVAVHAPRTATEGEGEGEGPAEPEVIGQKKADEE